MLHTFSHTGLQGHLLHTDTRVTYRNTQKHTDTCMQTGTSHTSAQKHNTCMCMVTKKTRMTHTSLPGIQTHRVYGCADTHSSYIQSYTTHTKTHNYMTLTCASRHDTQTYPVTRTVHKYIGMHMKHRSRRNIHLTGSDTRTANTQYTLHTRLSRLP